MATATKMQGSLASLYGNWLSSTIESVKTEYRRYRKFRATHDELRAFSDRDLQDIGLSRANVRDVALEAGCDD